MNNLIYVDAIMPVLNNIGTMKVSDIVTAIRKDPETLTEKNYNGETLLVHLYRKKKIDYVRNIASIFYPTEGDPENYGKIIYLIMEYAARANQRNPFELSLIEDLSQEHTAKNWKDIQTGDSVLHLAVIFNDKGILNFLLTKNYPLTLKNAQGKTPIELALYKKRYDLIQCICQRKAQENDPEHFGKVLLRVLFELNKTSGFFQKDNTLEVNICKQLIEADASISITNEQNETALHLAIIKKQPQLTHLLVQKGANIFCKSISGETPLHLAVKELNCLRILLRGITEPTDEQKNLLGEVFVQILEESTDLNRIYDVCELFIKSGASLDVQANNLLQTPLHIAYLKNWTRLIILLQDKGADPQVSDFNGKKPADLDVRSSMNEIPDNSLQIIFSGKPQDHLCTYLSTKNITEEENLLQKFRFGVGSRSMLLQRTLVKLSKEEDLSTFASLLSELHEKWKTSDIPEWKDVEPVIEGLLNMPCIIKSLSSHHASMEL